MTFQEQLNLYIEELSCSGRELAQNSGISKPFSADTERVNVFPGQTVII